MTLILGIVLTVCLHMAKGCSNEIAAFGCQKCVFVDATSGSDGGDGSVDKPYKTIAKAHTKQGVDGAVLKGTFNIDSSFTFKTGWSYTGFGSNTILEMAMQGKSIAVVDTVLIRMIIDFNLARESATFRGEKISFVNCVIRNQHTTDGTREMLYGSNSNSYLSMKNCLLYNVKFNLWVYRYTSNYRIIDTVSAGSSSSFTLRSQAPTVSVSTSDYRIISKVRYTDANSYGVWGGDCKYSWYKETPTTTFTTQTVTTHTVDADQSREIDSLNKQTNTLSSLLTTLISRVDAIEKKMPDGTALDDRISALEEDIRIISEDVSNNTAAIATMTQSIAYNTANITTVIANTTAITNAITAAVGISPLVDTLVLEKNSCGGVCEAAIENTGDNVKISAPKSVKLSGECGIVSPCELHQAVVSIASALQALKKP